MSAQHSCRPLAVGPGENGPKSCLGKQVSRVPQMVIDAGDGGWEGWGGRGGGVGGASLPVEPLQD